MNSEPLSESRPWRGKGRASAISATAARTPVCPRPLPRAGLDPGALDIGEIEGVDELAVGRVPGVRDQIRLGEAGRGDIPPIGLEGDVVFEQRPGLGAAIEAAAEVGLPGSKTPVHGPRADREELLLHRRGGWRTAPWPRGATGAASP